MEEIGWNSKMFTSVALKNKQTEFLDKNKKSFTMVGKMTYPRPL